MAITIENPIPMTSILEVSRKECWPIIGKCLVVSKPEFEHLPLHRIYQIVDFDHAYKSFGYNYSYLCRELKTVFLTRKSIEDHEN